MPASTLAFLVALALIVSEILTFYIFDLQKIGEGDGVQFSQLLHSMTNVIIYNKRHPHIFALALTLSEIYMFDLQNVGQGYGVNFWQLHHSMANINI